MRVVAVAGLANPVDQRCIIDRLCIRPSVGGLLRLDVPVVMR